MSVSYSSKVVLASIALFGLLAGCSTAPRERKQTYSTQEHYDRACESASRAIDTLMVHWENPRATEMMPAMQITQARHAARVITPICNNTSLAVTLDPTTKARVDSAFRTLESAARNLPRLPAGG